MSEIKVGGKVEVIDPGPYIFLNPGAVGVVEEIVDVGRPGPNYEVRLAKGSWTDPDLYEEDDTWPFLAEELRVLTS